MLRSPRVLKTGLARKHLPKLEFFSLKERAEARENFFYMFISDNGVTTVHAETTSYL